MANFTHGDDDNPSITSILKNAVITELSRMYDAQKETMVKEAAASKLNASILETRLGRQKDSIRGLRNTLAMRESDVMMLSNKLGKSEAMMREAKAAGNINLGTISRLERVLVSTEAKLTQSERKLAAERHALDVERRFLADGDLKDAETPITSDNLVSGDYFHFTDRNKRGYTAKDVCIKVKVHKDLLVGHRRDRDFFLNMATGGVFCFGTEPQTVERVAAPVKVWSSRFFS